ncbi:MAG: dihydroorotate dehydrogenase electron transfer subunit, partial [Deltaproteobacteria bacterium]|nr:dihydroorotate dehydrogenase electron transfer subunit [Deltaproteobacteria bacterium]
RYGRRVFLTGPFGNGFPRGAGHDTVVVAGGAGIASVFSLVQKLHERGTPYKLMYGARTEDELVLSNLLKPYDPAISTDDGSKGHHGKLTDLLAKGIEHTKTVFACGPLPMLAAVKAVTSRRGIECYVSLEARMACGFGVCLGCTIFDAKGNTRRVCKEGPVFDAKEVNLSGIH